MAITLPTAQVGRTNLHVPIVGLGTAHIAGYNGSDSAIENHAVSIVHKALEAGINFFDTAPLYRTEKYLGKALVGVPRDSYILQTKIGRLPAPDGGFIFDYSRDGVLRSIENSLKALQIDRIDSLLIHDPDEHYQRAIDEAYPTLADLRSQGVVKAIGAGMNQWEMLADFARAGEFDGFLLAGRYTLIEQTSLAALKLFQEKHVSVYAGGVYNSGILATGAIDKAMYQYSPAPEEVKNKVRKVQAVCDRYNVPLNAAAVQFVKAHPAVTSLVIGADSPEQITDNLKTLEPKIPAEFWADLRAEGIIEPDAPTPA